MGKIGIIITVAAMAVCTAFASEPKAKDPVALSLAPASLSLSTGDVVRATFRVSNISDHPVSFFLGKPRVFQRLKTICVDISGLASRTDWEITLGVGESRDMPIVVTQGREIPMLDAGDYHLQVQVRFPKVLAGNSFYKEAEVKITEKSGQAKDALTVNQIVKLAREYSEPNFRDSDLKVEYDSYRIYRGNSENWSVDFSIKGPNIAGATTITVNAKSQRAFSLAIPVTPR